MAIPKELLDQLLGHCDDPQELLAQGGFLHQPQDPDGVRADAFCRAKLDEHHAYIRAHGDDMPEIRDWTWPV